MRGLLLDVMDTVCHDPFYDEMPKLLGMSFHEMLRSKHPTAWLEFECGRLSEREFLARFFADRRAFDHGAFRRGVFASYRWLDGMETLVDTLVARRVPLGWVSNYSIWSEEVDRRLGLTRRAPWIFLSWKEGFRKPDPRVFQTLRDRWRVPPAETLFVDDREANVEAAAAAGYQTHLFRGATGLGRRIAAAGLSD